MKNSKFFITMFIYGKDIFIMEKIKVIKTTKKIIIIILILFTLIAITSVLLNNHTIKTASVEENKKKATNITSSDGKWI